MIVNARFRPWHPFLRKQVLRARYLSIGQVDGTSNAVRGTRTVDTNLRRMIKNRYYDYIYRLVLLIFPPVRRSLLVLFGGGTTETFERGCLVFVAECLIDRITKVIFESDRGPRLRFLTIRA